MARKSAGGTFNLFAELGFPDAHELTAKVMLATRINLVIREEGLTQIQAAKRTGIPRPKISAIRNYRLDDISMERLMNALVALNQRVEIVVTPAKRKAKAQITVAI